MFPSPKTLSLALLAIGLSTPAWAALDASHKNDLAVVAPKLLGQFGNWQAAKHAEGGAFACYAFAYPEKSQPALRGRGRVVLSVTHRAGERNVVALSAGYVYPENAAPDLTAGKAQFPLYTAQSSAFARDGATVVQAFAHADTIEIHGPAPHGSVTDSFSLHGFDRAYAAISKACPDHK